MEQITSNGHKPRQPATKPRNAIGRATTTGGTGSRTPLHQRGASLIEVLIAGLLLSIGVTGLAAAQISALQATNRAEAIGELTLLQDSVLDLLRLYPGATASGNYNVSATGANDWSMLDQSHPALANLVRAQSQPVESIFLDNQCQTGSHTVDCELCIGYYSADDRSDLSEDADLPSRLICQRVAI